MKLPRIPRKRAQKPVVRRDDVQRLRSADALLTDSLVRCLEQVLEEEGESEFVAVALEGLMSDTCSCCLYPPAGHSFPKEG